MAEPSCRSPTPPGPEVCPGFDGVASVSQPATTPSHRGKKRLGSAGTAGSTQKGPIVFPIVLPIVCTDRLYRPCTGGVRKAHTVAGCASATDAEAPGAGSHAPGAAPTLASEYAAAILDRTSRGISMAWWDDPVFDGMEETVDGKKIRGDDWRRLMTLRACADIRVVGVAGTTFRIDALRRVAQPNARLVAEPDNPEDSDAVRVELGGQHVGYVPRNASVPCDARVHVLKWGVDCPHV